MGTDKRMTEDAKVGIGVLAIICLIPVLCFCSWYFGLWPDLSDLPSSEEIALQKYESAYSTCIARETLSPEQCHDFALKAAYPED